VHRVRSAVVVFIVTLVNIVFIITIIIYKLYYYVCTWARARPLATVRRRRSWRRPPLPPRDDFSRPIYCYCVWYFMILWYFFTRWNRYFLRVRIMIIIIIWFATKVNSGYARATVQTFARLTAAFDPDFVELRKNWPNMYIIRKKLHTYHLRYITNKS